MKLSKNISNKKTFYITTPIYYANDKAHIGHAYCTIAADVLARWFRLKSREVFFSVGTDEHGQKVQTAANQAGVSPQAYTDSLIKQFKSLWKLLNISYDDFIRTTEKRHEVAVEKLIKKIWEAGDIYKDKYEGWYCVPCESFFTELQLAEGKCPDCNREVKKVSEEAYFFKLSKYQKPLLDFYETCPSFLAPKKRKQEILNRVKKGLKDLCLTRASVSWGIPFPYDKAHTIYVWIEALMNYVTVLDTDKKFKKFWPVDIHLVGKEINWFHSVIWPALLISANEALPHQVYAHGWWTVKGKKMSKSKGNVVDPVKVVGEVGTDAFRYFLLREISFGSDGDYSSERLAQVINSELANGLGNLVNRTLVMAEKYFSTVPKKVIDESLAEKAIETVTKVTDHIEKLEFQRSLQAISSLITDCNQYINEKKPWENKDEREKVIYSLLESLRFISVLCYPFMPSTSEKIFKSLGIKKQDLSSLSVFGKLKPKTKISKGEILFKKIE